MCKVLIFGGTTEGRLLAKYCDEMRIKAYVSTTTEYGAKIIDKTNFIHIISGRMDTNLINKFIKIHNIHTVIDATHPYAVEVTKNIKNACHFEQTEYFRIVRENVENIENALYFNDISSIISYLNTVKGNILLTIGSKNLIKYCEISNYQNRCVIRVLPFNDVLEKCCSIGFMQENIIAEKGPFSIEQNILHIRKFNIDFLITKDSGNTGGFIEKITAAEKCGVMVLILRRPNENGIHLDKIKNILSERHYE